MNVTGRQLRRLKELLPEDQRGEYQKIFAGAFNKEDVTKACQAVLNCSSSWGTITLRHEEKTIAIINLGKAKPGLYDMHEDYVFEVHHAEGKCLRVYKLRD